MNRNDCFNSIQYINSKVRSQDDADIDRDVLCCGWCVYAGGMSAGAVGARGGKELLSVDFKQGQILRYKQVSEREVQLDFDPGGKISKGSDKGRIQTMTERLEIVVAYKPVKVDSSGFSTIEATFEQVKPSRSSLSGQQPSGKDAVNYLQGKTITFTISPSGIDDGSMPVSMR